MNFPKRLHCHNYKQKRQEWVVLCFLIEIYGEWKIIPRRRLSAVATAFSKQIAIWGAVLDVAGLFDMLSFPRGCSAKPFYVRGVLTYLFKKGMGQMAVGRIRLTRSLDALAG